MFLKAAEFKKLINSAWKSHELIVGMREDKVYLHGGYWEMLISEDVFPNKGRAAIVEVAGGIPTKGYIKVGKDIKAELVEPDCITEKMEARMKTEFNITKVIYKARNKDVRVLQEPETQECILISERIMELIDADEIIREKEMRPNGPFAEGVKGQMLLWINDKMSLLVCKVLPNPYEENEIKDFLTLLSNTELEAEV